MIKLDANHFFNIEKAFTWPNGSPAYYCLMCDVRVPELHRVRHLHDKHGMAYITSIGKLVGVADTHSIGVHQRVVR